MTSPPGLDGPAGTKTRAAAPDAPVRVGRTDRGREPISSTPSSASRHDSLDDARRGSASIDGAGSSSVGSGRRRGVESHDVRRPIRVGPEGEQRRAVRADLDVREGGTRCESRHPVVLQVTRKIDAQPSSSAVNTTAEPSGVNCGSISASGRGPRRRPGRRPSRGRRRRLSLIAWSDPGSWHGRRRGGDRRARTRACRTSCGSPSASGVHGRAIDDDGHAGAAAPIRAKSWRARSRRARANSGSGRAVPAGPVRSFASPSGASLWAGDRQEVAGLPRTDVVVPVADQVGLVQAGFDTGVLARLLALAVRLEVGGAGMERREEGDGAGRTARRRCRRCLRAGPGGAWPRRRPPAGARARTAGPPSTPSCRGRDEPT